MWLTFLLRQIDAGVLRYSTASPTTLSDRSVTEEMPLLFPEDDPDIVYTVLTYFRPSSSSHRNERSIGGVQTDQQHAVNFAAPDSIPTATEAATTTTQQPESRSWPLHDSSTTILSYVSVHARNLMDSYWSAHVKMVYPRERTHSSSHVNIDERNNKPGTQSDANVM